MKIKSQINLEWILLIFNPGLATKIHLKAQTVSHKKTKENDFLKHLQNIKGPSSKKICDKV